MRTVIALMAVGMLIGGSVATAQTAQTRDDRASAMRAPGPDLQTALQLKESRYQIGQIERVLEGAVEHGATVIRDRLQAIMPADMLLTENARARGFRLDGYGVFFDVEVPSLEGTLWSFRTLTQNNLGADSALQTIRSFIETSSPNDVALHQALRALELQVAPISPTPAAALPVANGRTPDATANRPVPSQAAIAADPILDNPNEAYRAAIRTALIDAMLEHTRGLGLGSGEWLTVAARGNDDRPRLAPADPEGQTNLISIRGSDLAAFLAGQLSREEAIQRVEVRVF